MWVWLKDPATSFPAIFLRKTPAKTTTRQILLHSHPQTSLHLQQFEMWCYTFMAVYGCNLCKPETFILVVHVDCPSVAAWQFFGGILMPPTRTNPKYNKALHTLVLQSISRIFFFYFRSEMLQYFPESHSFVFSHCSLLCFHSLFLIILTVYRKRNNGRLWEEDVRGIKPKLKL